MKQVRVRPRADQEIDALAAYIALDDVVAALRFLDAVRDAFDLIGRQPKNGSLRFAHLPMLENLRVCSVTEFEKHLIFYVERPTYVDVVRVLHCARDLPAALMQE